MSQSLATATVSICYSASVQFIPVGLAVVILFTCPVVVLVLSPAIEGTRIGFPRFLTALLGFAGLAIAVGLQFDHLDWRGLVLAAMSAAGYAVQFFSGRLLAQHFKPAAMACLVHLFVLPVALLTVLWQEQGTLRLIGGSGVAVAGYIFVIAVALSYLTAYLLQMLSLRKAAASTIAPVFNIEPIVTTAVAALLLQERLSFHQYLGGAIVFAAVIAAGQIERRTVPNAEPSQP